MTKKRIQDIKHAQRESFLLKEIANFFRQITLDEPSLRTLSVNRVKLSSDRGICVVFFLAPGGKEEFEQKLSTLILYKPSVRNALSKALQGRYTPNLIFKYDEGFEKQQKLEKLFEELKEKGKL